MVQENPQRFSRMDIKRMKQAIKDHGQNALFNDLSTGKYDLVVTSGPNFTTERQETSEAMQRIISAYPELMKLAGDIVMGNMDFKDSDKLAKRIEKTLPMALREQKEGEPPPQPMPPSPQVQILIEKTKTEQIKQQKEQLAVKLKLIEIYLATKESQVEIRKEIIKVMAEVTGPKHPADQLLMARMQAQGGQTAEGE
jgi:hypothetical protein